LALRRRNIAVLLIHHAGKNGDQRGTSGREDMLDSVIKLEQVKDEVNEGAKFIVNFTKCRGAYGSDIDPFEALLNLEVPGSWTWQPVEDSTFNRMVRLAREGVDQVKDMADELGFSKGYISRLKRRGINEGIFKEHTRIILVDGES
jgi:putative DNA primase/helicase